MYRHNLGAHQFHTEDIGFLPFDVFCSHIDAALESKQRTGNSGGNAVLPGTCFGNDSGLAHAAGQKRLTQHLIGLVCAAVNQIFAFEIDRGFGALCQVAALCQRCRTTGIVSEQRVKFLLECRIILGGDEGFFELIKSGNKDFRDELAAESAEIRVELHDGLSVVNESSV